MSGENRAAPAFPKRKTRTSTLARFHPCHGAAGSIDSEDYFPAVKSHEIYAAVPPVLVTKMLDWFRANDRNVYRSAVATLAKQRKLRPVFIEKKPLVEQYAWLHKTLQIHACDSIGEQLLQAWLMSGQQPMLAAFCDAMGIPHNGQGAVVGDLPKKIDAERLDAAIDALIEKKFHPMLIAVYLHCFNLQQPGGWPELSAKLANDERLQLQAPAH